MESLRNKVIEVLGRKLGEEFKIIPKDRRKNNGLVLHGICIYKESGSVSPVIYMEDFIQYCGMWEPSLEEIADICLETYHQDKTLRNVADYLGDFGMVKDRVRIRLINHAANLEEMGNIPHRRFLDLAVTYYLDMEPAMADQYAFVTITNEWMERWGITEDDLYRLGMGGLFAVDGCLITDLFSILRQTAQENQDKIAEGTVTEIEKDRGGLEMYVASNKKHLFGANCLMNVSILQGLAERMGGILPEGTYMDPTLQEDAASDGEAIQRETISGQYEIEEYISMPEDVGQAVGMTSVAQQAGAAPAVARQTMQGTAQRPGQAQQPVQGCRPPYRTVRRHKHPHGEARQPEIHPHDGRKYIWLSSANYHMGTSSGSPIHLAGTPGEKTIFVTEDPLKGDLAHALSGRMFGCVPGENQYVNLPPFLKVMKQMETEMVYEAYDMDKLLKTICRGDYNEKCIHCENYQKFREGQEIFLKRKV